MTRRRVRAGLGALVAAAATLLPGTAAVGSLASPSSRLRPRREEAGLPLALLALGGLLWSAPALLAGASGAWLEGLQVLLVAACFYPLVAGIQPHDRRPVLLGLLAGLAVLVAASLMAPWSGERVAGWRPHPNIWAAQAVLPALAAAVLARRVPVALVALGLGGAVAVLAGSRGSLAGMVVGAAALAMVRLPRRRRAAAVLVLLVGTLGGALLLPRSRALIADSVAWLRRGPDAVVNLRQGQGQPLHVSREEGPESQEYPEEAGYERIRKASGVGWARLQYPLILHPGRPYALSLELRSDDPAALPGLLGTGRDPTTRERLVAQAVRDAGGWRAEVKGPFALVDFGTEPLEDGWTRLELVVRSEATRPVWWWVGPTPDQREGTIGAGLELRRLQFEGAAEASPFTAPALAYASVQAFSRLSAFRAAWQAVTTRPWLGRAEVPFSAYYRSHPPAQDIAVPVHAHNAFLQTLYERGVVGLTGLLLLVGVPAVAGLRADRAFLAPVVALVAVNLVDHLLWSSGMLYSLAAAAGVVALGRRGAAVR